MDLQSPIFKRGYGMVPKIPLEDPRLSAEAKLIYAYLCTFADSEGEAFPPVDMICKNLGMSDRRFFKHRKQLVDSGYISIQRPRQPRGFGRVVYTLNGDPANLQNVSLQNVSVQNLHNVNVLNVHGQNVSVRSVNVPSDGTNNTTINNTTINNTTPKNTILNNTPHTPQGGQGMLVEEAQPVKAEPARKPKRTRTKNGHAVNEQGKSIPGAKYRPEDFERWWAKYPEKARREKAVTEWETAIAKNALPNIDTLLEVLEWQIPLRHWRPRRNDDPLPNYTPNPATYICERRWQDERPALQPVQNAQAGYPRFQPTGKLQGMDLHNANMEAARIALARINQAKTEGKAVSPFGLPTAEANNG